MDPRDTDNGRLRKILFIPISLFIAWLIATQAPSQYEKIQDKLPAFNVNWDPGRSPYNESKLVLLIENRPLPHLTPLLLHMISVVPPEWHFLFLGSTESLNHTNASSTIQIHQSSGKLKLREMPDVGLVHEQGKIDRILTNLTFYQQYVDPAEWLLVFHTDSILCARSGSTMNDWLEYDWVGGRWSMADIFPGSGGLSLRRVSKLKEVMLFQDRQDDGDPEDRWFVGRIGTLPGAKLPSAEVERKFCVQNVYYDEPMGYHISSGGNEFDIAVWQALEQRKRIFAWCPEVKMILDMKLERERCAENQIDPQPEEDQDKDNEAKVKEEEEKKKLEDVKAAIKAELTEELRANTVESEDDKKGEDESDEAQGMVAEASASMTTPEPSDDEETDAPEELEAEETGEDVAANRI